MRLSQYPYVSVRIACSKCSRKGQYRLARLADKYGSETTLIKLMGHLAGDCVLSEGKRKTIYDRCGAFYPDLASPLPPDEPRPAPIRSKVKLVG